MKYSWRLWALLLAVIGLSGCIGGTWETSYKDIVSRSASNSWYPTRIDVLVPTRLTVSEENVFAPKADIVWHGDPAGDRKDQVKKILENATRNAGRSLVGNVPVRLEVELEQFHALSDRARLVAPSAVHNLRFKIRVFDARTGQKLVPSDSIRADFPAYTRSRALEAERLGFTQKVRITRHLEDVLKGWFSQGPDPRQTFKTLGR